MYVALAHRDVTHFDSIFLYDLCIIILISYLLKDSSPINLFVIFYISKNNSISLDGPIVSSCKVYLLKYSVNLNNDIIHLPLSKTVSLLFKSDILFFINNILSFNGNID